MIKYDYLEALKNDLREYISVDINLDEFDNYDELEDFLFDEVWAVDSVTGNGGNYYTNTQTATEYVCSNIELAFDAYDDLGLEIEDIKRNRTHFMQYLDCIIRIHLLPAAIFEVIQEMKKEDILHDCTT